MSNESDERDALNGRNLERLTSATEAVASQMADILARIGKAEDFQADVVQPFQDKQERQNKRLWLSITVAVLSVFLDLFLTVVVLVGAHRLSAVQDTTSGKVLCPLYSILNDSLNQDLDRDGIITNAERSRWNLQAKDANRDGKIDTEEEDAFRISALAIRNGYAALECAAPAK